jgi:hypothetical protein
MLLPKTPVERHNPVERDKPVQASKHRLLLSISLEKL